jgi:DNA-binding transcriptional MocR family regulator
MTQRWRETADMLRSRSVNNGAQRLAGLLLDLAARHGTRAGPATAITIPLSQEEIASLIGTSRATVTRALGDWRRRGLISTARHQITINSTPGLRSIANRDAGPFPVIRMARRKPGHGQGISRVRCPTRSAIGGSTGKEQLMPSETERHARVARLGH